MEDKAKGVIKKLLDWNEARDIVPDGFDQARSYSPASSPQRSESHNLFDILQGKKQKTFCENQSYYIKEVEALPFKAALADRDHDCRNLLELVMIDKFRQTG